MEITMVPSQFLSVVLEEDNGSGSEDETNAAYSNRLTWQNQYPSRSNNSISDQEMWNLTKNLPKALLAECTVEISRTPVNPSEQTRKPCFDARVSPIFNKPQPPVIPVMRAVPSLQQYLPPPPQLLHRSEWIEERMDVQDLLTGVEAVYSDNESDGEYEEAASVSIFPITVAKVEKSKPEKIKRQDISKFSYPCEHCPNVYSNRGALWQHSVATHSVEKTCECKICGRKFYRNCSLALHLKSHSEEEYCQCKECGKSFNRLANLERHMKVHAEVEKFPCTICDKVFKDKANLLRHTVCHTVPKMFHCETCNKSFKSQEHLEVHQQTVHAHLETSLACSTCGDVFSSFSELMQHDATHSSDKAHTCKFCGISFTDKNILKKHLMSHSGERLTCTLCGIDFTQKSSLLRHVKRMHPQDSDGIIDASVLLDDKTDATDNREGFSDNSSVQDMELDEYNETEQSSTAEIRKALGSPIKSGVYCEQSAAESRKTILDNCDTSIESVINNYVPKEESVSSKSLPDIDSLEFHMKTDNMDQIQVNITSEDKSAKDIIENVEISVEAISKAVETKAQVKADIADPLSSVDINTMHTDKAVRLEKPDLTTTAIN